MQIKRASIIILLLVEATKVAKKLIAIKKKYLKEYEPLQEEKSTQPRK